MGSGEGEILKTKILKTKINWWGYPLKMHEKGWQNRPKYIERIKPFYLNKNKSINL